LISRFRSFFLFRFSRPLPRFRVPPILQKKGRWPLFVFPPPLHLPPLISLRHFTIMAIGLRWTDQDTHLTHLPTLPRFFGGWPLDLLSVLPTSPDAPTTAKCGYDVIGAARVGLGTVFSVLVSAFCPIHPDWRDVMLMAALFSGFGPVWTCVLARRYWHPMPPRFLTAPFKDRVYR